MNVTTRLHDKVVMRVQRIEVVDHIAEPIVVLHDFASRLNFQLELFTPLS
jgi:hypothetical protein